MGNIKAENGVIGAILVNNDALEVICDILKPYMFSSEIQKLCYKTMLENWEVGRASDTNILAAQLERFEMSQEQISEFLIQCVNDAPSENRYAVRDYARLIIDEYKSSQLRQITTNFSLLPNSVDSEIGKLANAIEDLQEQTTVTRAKSLADIIKENKDVYFTKHVIKGVRTGFYKLDEALYSLEPGDVTVIGARPSVGKSAFSTQIILQIANSGKKVGYFNLEMDDSQVYQRMLAFCSRIDMNRLKSAESYSDDRERFNFERANETLSRFQIFIHSGSTSISKVRAESKHANYDVIVIDYLQLVKADKSYASRVSEVGDISKAIKALAMELKIPIILLSQLNRASEGRETKEPTMAELREAGDIEQDASNVLLLWNLSTVDDRYKGLKIDKNRQGKRGVYVGMEFKGNLMQFVESNEDWNVFQKRVRDMEKSVMDLRNYSAVEEEDAEDLFN